MKDLTVHVQPTGGLLLFPNTCRISGNETNPAGDKTICVGHSAPPGGPGHDRKPESDPCDSSRRPDTDHDRGPRRASDLDALRWALRRTLSL
jgi:hypothetical protein